MPNTASDPSAVTARFATYRASGLGKMRAYALTGRDLHASPYMIMTIVKQQADPRRG